MAPRQLTLDLPVEPRFGREDFLVSPSNAEAWDMFERFPQWPDRVLLLLGPTGAGKSHLGTIWAERAWARVVEQSRGVNIVADDVRFENEAVAVRARGGVIVEADLLEALDASRIAGAAIDVVAVEHGDCLRVKAGEGFAEAVPLRFHDLPAHA